MSKATELVGIEEEGGIKVKTKSSEKNFHLIIPLSEYKIAIDGLQYP